MFVLFSSRRRHTRSKRDWSSDVCSSDLPVLDVTGGGFVHLTSLDPRITFVSREDWTDCLPGSVVDVGSAIDGVVACDRSRRGIRSEERRGGKSGWNGKVMDAARRLTEKK